MAAESLPTSGKPRRVSKDTRALAANGSRGGATGSLQSTAGSGSTTGAGSDDIATLTTTVTSVDSRLKDATNTQHLEQCVNFLRSQQDELVTSLHEEVDRLKRKNRGRLVFTHFL